MGKGGKANGKGEASADHSKRRHKPRQTKAGLPPGTLVYTGRRRGERVLISVIDYDEAHAEFKEDVSVEEAFPYRDTSSVSWVNVSGIHDASIVERIGKHFSFHPLMMEDILHAEQRPKLEHYGDFLFIVLRMITPKDGRIQSEQLSIILGPSFVLSFQETEGDVFDLIRERIRIARGRIRRLGPDYLAYSLIDAVVDGYFVVLEHVGERIEELEEALTSNPSPAIIQQLHRLKREMIMLRKAVWPIREILNSMERQDVSLIRPETLPYLRDVYDHTLRVVDTTETYRDMLTGMMDLYLSAVSNRMNEVMKILTVIATIFIPLTFLAGVYGMNFRHFPEIEWRYGYALFWVISLSMIGGMLFYFRRKGWI